MKKKILLIEDDKIMRENTAEILELAKYIVLTAENGKEGSLKAKENPPDLIISDIMMPELDGYGVLHILSKDPITANIPFIFLTAKSEKHEMRKGMELGADDFLTKPFENTELLNAVAARFKKMESLNLTGAISLNGGQELIIGLDNEDCIEKVLQNKTTCLYKRKEIIFHEGDNPQYLYFILEGKVKTYKSRDDGKEFITNVYKEREFFGYSVLFENSKYKDSALVMEKSKIIKIPRNEFLDQMARNQKFSKKFIQMMSNYIEEQEVSILSLAYDSVRKRTAEALIKLNDSYNCVEENRSLIVSRDDLANLAGTATETVIRCLGDFKQENIIETHGREIKILDIQKLRKVQ